MLHICVQHIDSYAHQQLCTTCLRWGMCYNAESLASIARHNRRSYYLGADYFSQREGQVITLMQGASPLLASSWHTPETNPRGETLAFTDYYLMRNGQPTLPIMGEFHYSRFPHRYWEEE